MVLEGFKEATALQPILFSGARGWVNARVVIKQVN